MINYNKLYNIDPFSLTKNIKDPWYFLNQKKLSTYHYKYSKEYRLISKSLFKSIEKINKLSDLPYLHASIFKNFNLVSKNTNHKITTFKSSGTSGLKKTRINLDFKTAFLQSRTLGSIFSEIINTKMDIFFVETKNFLNSNLSMSAKGAAIKGFGQLCNNKYYLLNKNKKLDLLFFKKYLNKNKNKKFIVFGFTSSVWFDLLNEMKKKKMMLNKNNGILIHGGGWKKLHNLRVNNNRFKKEAKRTLGVNNVYNYYGMIEQTGSVFLECELGYYHPSIFSDIFIRNSELKLSKLNEAGLIQVLSLLPLSYPGHNILTEDIGILHGIDTCKCGRKGKYFTVLGRVPEAELRGCSDVG